MRKNRLIAVILAVVGVLAFGDVADAATLRHRDASLIGVGGTTCFANSPSVTPVGRVVVSQYGVAEGSAYQSVRVRGRLHHLPAGERYWVSLVDVWQTDDAGTPSVCGVTGLGFVTTNMRGRTRFDWIASGIQIGDAGGRQLQVVFQATNSSQVLTTMDLMDVLVTN